MELSATHSIQHRINKVIGFINQQNTTLFIFLLLCLNFLGFQLNANEEMYLGLAKQFYSPEWIKDSFSFTEFAGTRLIYQYFTGFLLQYVSFEQLTFWCRLFNFLLFAFPLAKLFRLFRLNNVEIFFLLQVVYFSCQSMFGGEWIFKGFETKTIAYALIFYSLYYLLSGKNFRSLIFIVFATYFHVLVGGWFFLLVMFYYLFDNSINFKTWIKQGVLYVLLCLPFIIYLARELLFNSVSEIEGVNLNWVYTYFRNSHHVALFNDIAVFFHLHLPGILVSSAFFVICVIYRDYFTIPVVKQLNSLNIIIFLMLFISLIIGLFDVNGGYLKYYPYRISALSMLFLVFQFGIVLKDYIKEKHYSFLLVLMLVFALPFLFYGTTINVQQSLDPREEEINELASFAIENTDPKDVFIFLDIEPDKAKFSFIRKSERDRFVVFKFVPSGGNKLYDWYVRILERKKVEKNIHYIFTLKDKYGLDYVVCKKIISHPDFRLVFKNEDYKVYKIEDV